MLTAVALTLMSAAGAPPYINGMVYITGPRTLVVQEHLRHIVANGWGRVTPGDLFHGHIVLSPRALEVKRFTSLEHLFSYSTMMLYHSDELLTHWRLEDGDMPLALRRPRSIIGFWNGDIMPAKWFFRDPAAEAPDYDYAGTIHDQDLRTVMPDRVDADHDWDVVMPNGICHTNLQLDIGLGHPPEPTIMADGKPQKLTLWCFIPR